mmetsp:Transcript_47584/g.85035  ORF Transcript_47584/g.85035 Transcript_47584/m.85035 type:complete len:282 (+) Transcript_47584:824-1669(+)
MHGRGHLQGRGREHWHRVLQGGNVAQHGRWAVHGGGVVHLHLPVGRGRDRGWRPVGHGPLWPWVHLHLHGQIVLWPHIPLSQQARWFLHVRKELLLGRHAHVRPVGRHAVSKAVGKPLGWMWHHRSGHTPRWWGRGEHVGKHGVIASRATNHVGLHYHWLVQVRGWGQHWGLCGGIHGTVVSDSDGNIGSGPVMSVLNCLPDLGSGGAFCCLLALGNHLHILCLLLLCLCINSNIAGHHVPNAGELFDTFAIIPDIRVVITNWRGILRGTVNLNFARRHRD